MPFLIPLIAVAGCFMRRLQLDFYLFYLIVSYNGKLNYVSNLVALYSVQESGSVGNLHIIQVVD